MLKCLKLKKRNLLLFFNDNLGMKNKYIIQSHSYEVTNSDRPRHTFEPKPKPKVETGTEK